MTVEEIKAQCATLSNEELYLIVTNKIRYDYVIVAVAQGEIKRRGLSKEEFKELKGVQTRRSKIIEGDIYTDLLWWQKLGLFVICVPRLHFLLFRDYRREKYILKLRQSSYFTVAGLASFALFMGGLQALEVPLEICAIAWVLGFVPAYLFNQYYFKQRTIRRLAARLDASDSGDSR
jgi:hypothetical protein